MDTSLPQSLAERTRWIVSADRVARDPGEFVLYWMHNAMRAHENPALDTAICLARQNGLPLLVYHGLSEDYPFSSDRHHAFMLQGHRDVQRELSDRGIAATFHLQRQGQRGPYLRTLTRAAAALVTEEMPVQPVTGWLERLATRCDTPIATVDCSCIAPVTMVDGLFTGAAEFRQHVQPLHDARIDASYVEQDIDVPMCNVSRLEHSFDLHPLSLQDADLASLIGLCRIDHSVAPVADTPGGSRSGYHRWEQFKKHGLANYSENRNDPNAVNGCSRMSAYLHYGMVSPFRIARESFQLNAEKFLEELLVWRELAFHFCFHHFDAIDTLDAIPDWARNTLNQHHEDPRHSDCSWESLARGHSGRPLWDAAQRSLIKHGELHNNVRMTWGKAILPWLKCPSRALQLTLDLNHRFALDGRNPSSYGGVLWCYGQFDKPYEPEVPILGQIRPRDIDQHSGQMDLDRYRQHVDRPIAASLPRVAVVGAGIGGLAAARTLADHGIEVTIFDKSKGVGGRAATRRATSQIDGSAVCFNHGTQYFTARDSRFRKLVSSWIQDGLAEPWRGRVVELSPSGTVESERNETPRYVGTANINSIAKHLSQGLSFQLDTKIDAISSDQGKWKLHSDGEACFGPFDTVLLNCPAPQTLALIDGHSDIADTIRSVDMRPCWALMVADDSLGEVPFDGAFVNDSPIGWMARSGGDSQHATAAWVIHATAQWSEQHVDDSPQDVVETLLPILQSILQRPISRPHHLAAHRWLYATAENPLTHDCLFDSVTGLGACGDWCGGTRVEAAFLSGVALAGTLLRRVTIDRPASQDGRATEPSFIA